MTTKIDKVEPLKLKVIDKQIFVVAQDKYYFTLGDILNFNLALENNKKVYAKETYKMVDGVKEEKKKGLKLDGKLVEFYYGDKEFKGKVAETSIDRFTFLVELLSPVEKDTEFDF